MKIAKVIAFVVLLGIAGFAVKYYFFPDPERVIRKELAELAEAMNRETSGNISTLANANSIAGHFTSDVTINIEGRFAHTLQGRDELLQMAMAARSRVGRINLTFTDMHVMVDPGGETARVHLTALVRINNEPDLYVQELKMQLRKLERDWLIAFIEPARQPKPIP
ncbi:MAG: nuclear transport factor 2 family protein [Verrucomicrobiales bacterium]